MQMQFCSTTGMTFYSRVLDKLTSTNVDKIFVRVLNQDFRDELNHTFHKNDFKWRFSQKPFQVTLFTKTISGDANVSSDASCDANVLRDALCDANVLRDALCDANVSHVTLWVTRTFHVTFRVTRTFHATFQVTIYVTGVRGQIFGGFAEIRIIGCKSTSGIFA
jgi:hypothetical protein